MRTFTFLAILILYAGLSLRVQAAPVMVPALRDTADTYTLFYIDPKRLDSGVSVAQEQAILTSQLAALSPPLKPCFAAGDLNPSNIRCGKGNTQMQLGTSEVFGYDLETLLIGAPITVARGVRELWFSNFMSPNGTIPGDSVGRLARIHFTGRMAQFGMLVDPGLNASLASIQFIVNGQALPPKPLTTGVVQFVGVEDPQGFTDLTIIAGGVTRAFVADKLAFVPLANF
ncbi:MAG: hypothetical protein LUQ11_02760 [Methylococcaceae bacterium]|nr:hypothetical protein [Methylococcaceae bacterium]